MRRLADPVAHERVVEALKSDSPASLEDWELCISGEPVSKSQVLALSVSRPENEIAVVLEADLATPTPISVKGKDVTLDLLVAGVPIRRFTGRALKSRNEGTSPASPLTANTAGYWLSRIQLGEEKSYYMAEPDLTAFEMLSYAPYSGAHIDVTPTKTPLFAREAGEGLQFTELDYPSDVLDGITEECGLVFADTADNGCRGRVPKPAGLSGEVVWEFVVGIDLDEDDFSYEGAVEEYSGVRAYRNLPDGRIEWLTDEVGITESSAPEGAVFLVESSDFGPDAEANARRQVQEIATNLTQAETPGQATLPFIHGLLEDGDAVAFADYSEEEDEYVERRFLCRITHQEEIETEKRHTLNFVGVITSEKRIPVSPEERRGGGAATMAMALWGYDYAGRGYFDDSLPWMVMRDGYGEFDPDLASEYGVLITATSGAGEHTR